MTDLHGSISGGQKLRLLRKRCKLSQFDLELEKIIFQSNYSKIERGEALPTRDRLDAILDAFNATFNERQGVLKSFGYLPPYPLPNTEEIAVTCVCCQPILDAVPMPAYLMDFLTRFLAWNRCFARLLGIHEESSVLEEMRSVPLFKSQFDSRVRLGQFMANMQPYLLAEAKSIRERLAPYQEEDWYEEFVEELCSEPEFNRYWHATQQNASSKAMVTKFAARALQPVHFSVPGFDTQLRFYANLDELVDDDRFAIVYLIAADAFTVRHVERWLDMA